MNKKQEEHLAGIKACLEELVDHKYRVGAEEHKSENDGLYSCSPKQLINFAIDEAIDQVVYLLTLRDKIVTNS